MYASFITQYSSATKEETDYYLQYIYELNGEDEVYYHELDLEFFNSFPDKYVLPNITDADLRKRFLELKAKFITMKNSAMGKALGEIFNTRNGYTPSKSNKEYWENGNIPWFRMEDIRQNGRILSEATQKVTKDAIKGELFPANSIIGFKK